MRVIIIAQYKWKKINHVFDVLMMVSIEDHVKIHHLLVVVSIA